MTEQFDLSPDEEREYQLSRARIQALIRFEDKQFAKIKARAIAREARRRK